MKHTHGASGTPPRGSVASGPAEPDPRRPLGGSASRTRAALGAPGLRLGDYPERAEVTGVPRFEHAAPAHWRALAGQVRRVRKLAATGCSEPLRMAVQALVRRDGLTGETIAACVALAVAAAREALSIDAYDGQIAAALVMLDNRLAEMGTGEGKSLSAALAAAAGALAGLPVHVLTANDYLVERDAQTFAPLYAALALSAGAVTATLDPAGRRAAYAQPIAYATASELVFDHLRDRLQHGTGRALLARRAAAIAEPRAERPLLRGLAMVVIDEADSILIDEAQMPLVLSRQRDGAEERAWAWQAFAISAALVEGSDFVRIGPERRIELTAAGRSHVERLAARLTGAWKNRRHREETLVTALTARHALERDRDYVVVDGDKGPQVCIVDPHGGRVAIGRRWSRGLHAIVAMKEGCAVEPEVETISQITYQRFFRRYLRIGGMSGTLGEARRELLATYGLQVVPIAPRLPSRRVKAPTRCFVDDASRWQAVVARVHALAAAGRPVLVGTDSVAASLALSLRLREAGIVHAVLHARSDGDEAALIGAAGRSGCVTVSTQMAGRGSHITLDDAALAAGGLHVLLCQSNASRRIDRQLAGRAARQGQPGSAELFLSLQSRRFAADGLGRLFAHLFAYLFAHPFARPAKRPAQRGEIRLPPRCFDAVHALLQRIDEARAAMRRRRMFRADVERDRGLTFCNPST